MEVVFTDAGAVADAVKQYYFCTKHCTNTLKAVTLAFAGIGKLAPTMPAESSVFEEMSASVLAATQDLDGVVTIDNAAIEKLAAGAEAETIEKAELPLRGLPLRFENLEAEVGCEDRTAGYVLVWRRK